MGLSTPLDFGPFQNRACTHVTIKNDTMLEQRESFSVKIDLTRPFTHILIEKPSTNIVIINDDGKILK